MQVDEVGCEDSEADQDSSSLPLSPQSKDREPATAGQDLRTGPAGGHVVGWWGPSRRALHWATACGRPEAQPSMGPSIGGAQHWGEPSMGVGGVGGVGGY